MRLQPRLPRRGVFAASALATLCALALAGTAPTEHAPLALPSGASLGDGVSGVLPASLEAGKRAVGRAVRFDALDSAVLTAEDSTRRAARPERKLVRTGVVRRRATVHAPHRFDRSREVTRLDDGRLLWTLDLTAPGATAIRACIRRCDLPTGAELVVSNPDRPGEAFGPLFPRVDRGDAVLWLPTVFAERVRIDLTLPATSARERVRFDLDRVLHHYRPLDDERLATSGAASKAGACQVDAQCEAELFANLGHSVGRMSFVSGRDSYVCTGTLLNDNATDTSIPWFLTANHCISTTAEASSLEVFWDYYADGCGGSVPALISRPRTSGAVLAATSTVTDFSLLRLTGAIPSGRTFAGWTTDLPGTGEAVYGVHHPEGTHMRASAGVLDRRDAAFHDVRWSSGVTEPGSSGSPLVDAAGLVIGQLCCGDSACSNPTALDSYGRLDRAYDALRPYLDPSASDEPELATYVEPFPFVLDRNMRLELGAGEWARWTVDVETPPANGRRTPKLKVRVKGRRGTYVRIVFPDSSELIVRRNYRARKIFAPQGGTYRVELHAGLEAPPKVLAVKLTRAW